MSVECQLRWRKKRLLLQLVKWNSSERRLELVTRVWGYFLRETEGRQPFWAGVLRYETSPNPFESTRAEGVIEMNMTQLLIVVLGDELSNNSTDLLPRLSVKPALASNLCIQSADSIAVRLR